MVIWSPTVALLTEVRLPSGLVMWCVLYDLGCVLCCVYDLVWNLKTYLRNARHWPGPSFDDSTHSLENTREACVCVIVRVCVIMCVYV